MAEKTGRGDVVTEKIEEDPAARIQRSALKKKTQLHRGALKMIIQSETSSRQKIYCTFIQESNRKRKKHVTFRPQGFIRQEDMTRRLDENDGPHFQFEHNNCSMFKPLDTASAGIDKP